MTRLLRLHPYVQLMYFVLLIVITLSFNNPFISIASLFGALLYTFANKGRTAFKTVLFSLVVILTVGVFNMLFAHYGVSVLFNVGRTEFTLEALAYGLNQGTVMASSLIWFTVFGRVIDGERLVYILRFAPKTALLFSMVLGFIPRFLKKLGEIREARSALRGGLTPSGLKARLKEDIDCLSALVTYSLESSIITSSSMQARGFNPKAVRGRRYKFGEGDFFALITVLLLSAVVIIQKATGNFSFTFSPRLSTLRLSIPAVVCFVILSAAPAVLIIRENIKWKLLNSKA